MNLSKDVASIRVSLCLFLILYILVNLYSFVAVASPTFVSDWKKPVFTYQFNFLIMVWCCTSPYILRIWCPFDRVNRTLVLWIHPLDGWLNSYTLNTLVLAQANIKNISLLPSRVFSSLISTAFAVSRKHPTRDGCGSSGCSSSLLFLTAALFALADGGIGCI